MWTRTNKIIFTKTINAEATNIDDIEIIDMKKDKLCYLMTEVPTWDYKKESFMEKKIIEWVKNAYCDKDKIFLDIGANCGTYTISLANKCKKVYSFEPQLSNYYALCGGVFLSQLGNVECIRIGLGSLEQCGKQKLYLKSSDGGSGVHSSLFQYQKIMTNNIITEEEIEIKTLDELQLSNIGFIKIDVEENEINVIKGAKETIIRNNFPHILFESNTEEEFERNASLLLSYGYKHVYRTYFLSMYLASNQ